MIKVFKIMVLLIFIGLLIFTVPTNAQNKTISKPVDLSNSIFTSCGLDKIFINGKKNQLYIVNCALEVIEFVILLALLLAILKVSLDGLSKMDPTGSNRSPKKTIQNLFIGIMLMSTCWVVLPILNASANNVEFMNLPQISYPEHKKNTQILRLANPVKTYECEQIIDVLGRKGCIIKQ